jgi:hypothetical protein
MIEDCQVDRFACPGKLARCLAIGAAGPRIATGVIVGKHDAHASKPRRVDHDLSNRHADGFGFAVITLEMDAAGAVIEMSDPKPFQFTAIVEAGGKKAAGSIMAVQERRGFGTLIPHAGNPMCSADDRLSEQNPIRMG